MVPQFVNAIRWCVYKSNVTGWYIDYISIDDISIDE